VNVLQARVGRVSTKYAFANDTRHFEDIHDYFISYEAYVNNLADELKNGY